MVYRLQTVLFVCLILNLALFLWTTITDVRFPYGLDYGEAPLIDQAERIAARQVLYKTTLNSPPYVIANYPPLYPLLIAGVGTITGLPFLQVGRAISLIAVLLSGLVVGLLAYELSDNRLSGLIAATLFLGNPFVMKWSAIARVDMVALSLSLLSLWLLYRHWHSWQWLTVALICLVAAIYTRQTFALAVPVAGSVWLWHNDRRRCLIFITVLALTCLALFGMLNFITRGGFYLNTVTANVNSYTVIRLLTMMAGFLRFWPFAIVIAGNAVLQAYITRSRKNTSQNGRMLRQPFIWSGLAVYSLGALASALTVGKIGSNVNYFLELEAALAVWAACVRTWEPERPVFHQLSITALLLCQVVWGLVGGMTLYQISPAVRWRNLAQDDALYREVKTATRQGPVLADENLDKVVLAGQRIYFQPFEYRQLYRAGIWDPSALIAKIANHRFPLVLIYAPGTALSQERWPQPVMAAIEKNYKVTDHQGETVVYKPRESAPKQ